MSVLVAHPLTQHSYQLALALQQSGMLSVFVTSFYDRWGLNRFVPGTPGAWLRRRWHPDLRADLVKSHPLPEFLMRYRRHIPGRDFDADFDVFLRGFDRKVSESLRRHRVTTVVGYEMSTLETFREARRIGATCILDAAAVHCETQQRELPRAETAVNRAQTARKLEEIELADHIITLSTFARDSYLRAGVDGKKLAVIPLGAEFATAPPSQGDRHPFRFLFAGNLTRTKGVDLLLRAFSSIADEDCELRLAGAAVSNDPSIKQKLPRVRALGYLDRRALAAEYASADVLVLPSRCDGFGQVVLEAMSCGLPAIASSHVGAKDLIIEGVNGWIFESGDAEALARLMLKAVRARADLAGMRQAAASTARGYTWAKYRERCGRFFSVIQGPGA